jgi:putative sigma-54 modulation protein
VQIEISTRHGELEPDQHRYLHDKAEKLLKYFGRLMAIEIAVDQGKHAWNVEILVSAEHKHDFVARESGSTPEAAMDQCVHKIEQQLRRYKERVQNHKGDVTHAGPSPRSSDHPESREAASTDSEDI